MAKEQNILFEKLVDGLTKDEKAYSSIEKFIHNPIRSLKISENIVHNNNVFRLQRAAYGESFGIAIETLDELKPFKEIGVASNLEWKAKFPKK